MKTNNVCRMCGSKKLSLFFDLGKMALANSFLMKPDLKKKENIYPLRVFFCHNCNLCQLIEIVDPKILFRDYVYFSSGMPVLPEHFKNYAKQVHKNFISSADELVVELGSNDGILLQAFKDLGAKVLGVDPAVNIAKIANERGIETLPEFFSEKLAKKIQKKYGNAKAIIGNNVVAHINDHQDLVKAIKLLLAPDGVFIFEAPYLVDMFENFTFDTIYHEHLSYLAVRPVDKLFEKYNMEIFDVQIFPVQGNSLRVYVCKKGKYQIQPTVEKLKKKELKLGFDKLESYKRLVSKIEQMKQKVNTILTGLKKQGKKIAAYGAPAKGNTLLNYYGIGSEVLDYVTEELPSKINLYTPGTHLKVIDIKEARNNPPDFYLLLAWNYKETALSKEELFRKKGGKFIMPVGDIEII